MKDIYFEFCLSAKADLKIQCSLLFCMKHNALPWKNTVYLKCLLPHTKIFFALLLWSHPVLTIKITVNQ